MAETLRIRGVRDEIVKAGLFVIMVSMIVVIYAIKYRERALRRRRRE